MVEEWNEAPPEPYMLLVWVENKFRIASSVSPSGSGSSVWSILTPCELKNMVARGLYWSGLSQLKDTKLPLPASMGRGHCTPKAHTLGMWGMS